MTELLRLQSDFAAALRDAGAAPRATRWIAGDAALAADRLAIHRANMVASATKALVAAYPVVTQVVGEEFFGGLAREFQRGTPSTSGDLTRRGATFPDFLARFPHTQDLPYLPGLARLEWAAHLAYGAADAPTWNAAELAAVAPDDQAAVVFGWAAGTAVVPSTFPVVRIWTIHQPGHDGDASVDWGVAEHALVARRGFAVTVDAITAGESAFLRAALAGGALGAACGEAVAADPDFDLGLLLARAVRAGLITQLLSPST